MVLIIHKIAYNFTAALSLLPTDQGGRKNPVFNHYRPSFSFGSKQHFSGEIIFSNTVELHPGNAAIAKIKLLPSRHINEHLKPGTLFKIFEGEKVVGMGIINSIDDERHIDS
jgi:translation elongation factor EF-Tu-like GTPase